jgi:DNA-binding CsgD family transcriptional regulator
MRHLNLIHSNSGKFNPLSNERQSSMRRANVEDAKPTPRELQVEDLLCRGYSQENIAAIFGRSVNTISAQAMTLYRKRGVHTQVGLLLAYLERKGVVVFADEGASRGSHGSISLGAAQ